MQRSSKCFLSIMSLHRNPSKTSTASYSCHIPRLSHSFLFLRPNIWWIVHRIRLNLCALKGLSVFLLDLILSVFCNTGCTVNLDKSWALQVSNRFSAYLSFLMTFNFTANGQDLPTYVNDSLFYARGHAVAHLVEALRYKSEVRGFDFRWCHWNFSLT